MDNVIWTVCILHLRNCHKFQKITSLYISRSLYHLCFWQLDSLLYNCIIEKLTKFCFYFKIFIELMSRTYQILWEKSTGIVLCLCLIHTVALYYNESVFAINEPWVTRGSVPFSEGWFQDIFLDFNTAFTIFTYLFCTKHYVYLRGYNYTRYDWLSSDVSK